MSTAALAATIVIIAAFVIIGVVGDHMRELDRKTDIDRDELESHRQLMRELKKHADNDVKWRP